MLLYKIMNNMSEKAAEPGKENRLKRRIINELKKADEEYKRAVMLNEKRIGVRRRTFN